MINDEQPDDADSPLSEGHFESHELLNGGLRAAFSQNSTSELGWKTTLRPDNPVPAESGRGERKMETPSSETRSSEIPRQDPSGTFCYKILREIGRGGMGAVLEARDEKLGRDLVVKVLLKKHQNSADARRRFVNEGRICSQLQHPNIVPVYEIGQLGDRPFFSMKRIDGETLAQLLQSRKTPNDDRQKLLNVFEKVCEAMAYAHSRGVIHRDLKPANIMVGSFGEVQVMDWGLAKTLSIDGNDDDLDFELAASEGSDESHCKQDDPAAKDLQETRVHTAAGDILGTPAFMAPEQLRGDTRSVDQRTDVFLLGTTLYVILTGQIPFQRHDKEEAARKEQLNQALSQLQSCDGHADLKKLVADCLAHEPSMRPRDAGEVAARLFEHRENVERGLRQSRRRQTWTLMIAASMIAATLIGSGSWLWISQLRDAQLARFDGLLHDADTLLGAAEQDAGKRATTSLDQARVLLVQAEHQSRELHSKEVDRRLETITLRMDLAERFRILVERLETIREDRGDKFDYQRANDQYFDAFKQFGVDLDSLTEDEAAERFASTSAHTQIGVALYDCALVRSNLKQFRDDSSYRRFVELANSCDPDPLRNRIRSSFGLVDDDILKSFVEVANQNDTLERESPESLVILARRIQNAGDDVTARNLLIRTLKRFPGDFWTNFELGSRDFKIPIPLNDKLTEQVRFLYSAIALRPSSSASFTNLGNVFKRLGRIDDAIEAYLESIRLNPNNAISHHNLGTALQSKGRMTEAISYLEATLRIDSNYYDAHLSIGNIYFDKNDFEGAEKEYRKAIAINSQRAVSHYMLAKTLVNLNRLDEATQEYELAIQLAPKLSRAYVDLGVILNQQGKLEESLARFTEAAIIDPTMTLAHSNRGDVLFDLQRFEESRDAFQEAIVNDPKWAVAHRYLGLIHIRKREFEQAIAPLKRAIELDPSAADAHMALGSAFAELGRNKEAIEEFHAAIKFGSTHVKDLETAIQQLEALERSREDSDESAPE